MDIEDFKKISIHEEWFYNWLKSILNDEYPIQIQNHHDYTLGNEGFYYRICLDFTRGIDHTSAEYKDRKLCKNLVRIPFDKDLVFTNDNTNRIFKSMMQIIPDVYKDFRPWGLIDDNEFLIYIKILVYFNLLVEEFERYLGKQKSILVRPTLTEFIKFDSQYIIEKPEDMGKDEINPEMDQIESQKIKADLSKDLWKENDFFSLWSDIIYPFLTDPGFISSKGSSLLSKYKVLLDESRDNGFKDYKEIEYLIDIITSVINSYQKKTLRKYKKPTKIFDGIPNLKWNDITMIIIYFIDSNRKGESQLRNYKLKFKVGKLESKIIKPEEFKFAINPKNRILQLLEKFSDNDYILPRRSSLDKVKKQISEEQHEGEPYYEKYMNDENTEIDIKVEEERQKLKTTPQLKTDIKDLRRLLRNIFTIDDKIIVTDDKGNIDKYPISRYSTSDTVDYKHYKMKLLIDIQYVKK